VHTWLFFDERGLDREEAMQLLLQASLNAAANADAYSSAGETDDSGGNSTRGRKLSIRERIQRHRQSRRRDSQQMESTDSDGQEDGFMNQPPVDLRMNESTKRRVFSGGLMRRLQERKNQGDSTGGETDVLETVIAERIDHDTLLPLSSRSTDAPRSNRFMRRIQTIKSRRNNVAEQASASSDESESYLEGHMEHSRFSEFSEQATEEESASRALPHLVGASDAAVPPIEAFSEETFNLIPRDTGDDAIQGSWNVIESDEIGDTSQIPQSQ